MDKAVNSVDNPAAEASAGVRRSALGIFAKEPVPGQVKTRLCPPLSAEEAAGLYRACLEETVFALGRGDWELVLFYAGREEYFRAAFPGLTLLPQGDGGLGERLDRAFAALFDRGYRSAAMVGSDSPDLPPQLVRAAFTELRRAPFVTAPSRDGGYVLVGQRGHHPELFRDIPWSSPQVLTATRCRAAEAGVDYREVEGWEDVDDLPSLRRLLERSPGSAAARYARRHLAHRL